MPPGSGDWAWVNSPSTFALAALIAFVSAVLYSILRGKVIPAATLDVLTVQWEARLDESREREQAWRTAYESTEAARSELSGQVGQLVVLARTTEALLRALPSGRGET